MVLLLAKTDASTVLDHSFLATLGGETRVDDAVFLVDSTAPLQIACSRHGLDFRYKKRRNRDSVERVFRKIK